MHITSERSDVTPTTQGSDTSGNFRTGVNESVTRHISNYSFHVVWAYHQSIEWILCCLVDAGSREGDRKAEHVRTLLPRVDSGIGLCPPGQQDGQSSPSSRLEARLATASTPITLTFHLEDSSTTKILDYRVYTQWTNVSTLLHELAHDGIIVHMLWDVNEDMPISSGDWDARIQPGSLIEAWCFSDVREDDWEGDSSGNESEDDMEGDKVEDGYRMNRKGSRTDARNEHTWWFTRWRQRVEKTMPGEKEALDEPSWFMMVVWCTYVVGIVILVTVLSL